MSEEKSFTQLVLLEVEAAGKPERKKPINERKNLLHLMIRNPGSVLIRHKNDSLGLCWKLRSTTTNEPIVVVSDSAVEYLSAKNLILPTQYEGRAAYELADCVQVAVVTPKTKKPKADLNSIVSLMEREKLPMPCLSTTASMWNGAIEKCIEIVRSYQKK